MKRLKEMIECVRIKGVRVSDTVADHDPALGDPDKQAAKLFFTLVEKCQPFVLFSKSKTPLEIIEEGETFDPSEPIADAPFEVYSIEMFGDFVNISVPRKGDRIKVYTKCLLAYEHKPMKFLTFAFTEAVNPNTGNLEPYVMLTAAYHDILKDLTKRISKEEVGYQIVNEKIKLGTGNDKRFHRIKRVVYVKPKKVALPDAEEKQAKLVNWSHRWFVRGHWRKFAGLGKDREGNYCVENLTWVTEHTKGPEDQPLIHKTRIVKDI